jgi:DNA-binding SARP family transcriptional activator
MHGRSTRDKGTAVRFRVLGPLEATADDGWPLRLPAGRAQIVLALLCASAGRHLASDWLVETAWDGAPPASGANRLQAMISALRAALPAGVIATRGRGYVLLAGEADIDLTQLRRLRALAREQRARQEAERAAGSLEESLALWHDRPFAGLACAELDAEADRIEQEHLGILEEHAELGLELGRHVALADSLTQWCARHPLRENLRAFLIQALLRSGRQAEAVEAYHDLRRHLSDELGIDPSPNLQTLYQRILAGDEEVMARIAEDWTVAALADNRAHYVLGALRRYERPLQFSELRRALDGIPQQTLAQTLRTMERDGLLSRTVNPAIPPRVEYGLTALGIEAGRLTSAISDWSAKHAQEILTARRQFDDRLARPWTEEHHSERPGVTAFRTGVTTGRSEINARLATWAGVDHRTHVGQRWLYAEVGDRPGRARPAPWR